MASGVIKNDRGFYVPVSNDSMTAKEICESVTVGGRLFMWAKYGAVSYTPVQKSNYWTYRLFHPLSNSHDYDIFEAFNVQDGEYYYYSYRINKWYKVTSAAV